MAKKSQPSKGQTGQKDQSRPKGSTGDSKGSMDNLRKAMEIPPKTGSDSSSDSKKSKD